MRRRSGRWTEQQQNRRRPAGPGIGGARTAFFSSRRRFTQKITEWRPFERYAFTKSATSPWRRQGQLVL